MRLVLRQQSNAFPQPWCGNPFARDRSSPGAHQKHSPAAHLHQPNPHLTRLPSKRASAVSHRVPRLPNQGRPTLKKNELSFSVPRATGWLSEAFGICTHKGAVRAAGSSYFTLDAAVCGDSSRRSPELGSLLHS